MQTYPLKEQVIFVTKIELWECCNTAHAWTFLFDNVLILNPSRSQSLRYPWPAVRKRELWEQPFWNNQILSIRFHCAVCIYGARLKLLLPELSFSDRWSRGTKTLGTRLILNKKYRSLVSGLSYLWLAQWKVAAYLLFEQKHQTSKTNESHK